MTILRRPRGRPRTGLKTGDKFTDYPRLSVRLPPETRARLLAIATVTGEPGWRVLVRGVDLVRDALDAGDRRLVDQLTKREVARQDDDSADAE